MPHFGLAPVRSVRFAALCLAFGSSLAKGIVLGCAVFIVLLTRAWATDVIQVPVTPGPTLGNIAVAAPRTMIVRDDNVETLEVPSGYSQVVKPSKAPGTIIVGDNDVADATVGAGNSIILTGKATGSTNVIVLDDSGDEILAAVVNVVPVDPRPQTRIRVIKSGSTEEYVCGPEPGCSPVGAGRETTDAPVVVEDTGAATAVETPPPDEQVPEEPRQP